MQPQPFVTVDEACRLLLSENVVAVPTETVYGLAALAKSRTAVDKIYRVKSRPADNPLICHFHSFQQAVPYLASYPTYVDILQRCFSPGPVSYLLPLKVNSPLECAVRHQPNVIVRIPAHPILLALLRCVGEPLAAPSANTSGRYSPTSAPMVAQDIGDKVDGILDGGVAESGIESTILDCTDSTRIGILRPGAVGKNDVEEALQKFGLTVPVFYSRAAQPTPGSTHKHYAPATPIERLQNIHDLPDINEPVCVLATDETFAQAEVVLKTRLHPPTRLSLGSENHPATIAQNLYANLARLDELRVTAAYLIYPVVQDPDWEKALVYRLDKITEKR